MKDVYVLLHKSQADYNYVVERSNVSDERISTHEDMLKSLSKEMKEGFKAVSDLIKDSMQIKVSRQTEEISVPLQNNEAPSEMSPPLVSEHITFVEEEVNLNESPDLVETKDAKEMEEHLGEEDVLEEGEIRDSPINGNNATNVAIGQQISEYRRMHQVKQTQQQQQQQPQHHQGQRQPSLEQRQIQQQQQQNPLPMPEDMAWSEFMQRSRPRPPNTHIPPQGQTRTPQDHTPQSPHQNGGNYSISGGGHPNSPFLKKKQKKNIILDGDDGSIPFSAIRDLYKYELFVTSIDRDAKVENIKSHLIKKLGTNDISIKPMSKSTASYLSFGVFCRSESKDLNFKMPGLWPNGTRIYKWNTKGGDTRVNNRVHSSQDQARSRSHNGVRSAHYNQVYHGNEVRRNDYKDNYRYRYPDQQRLHDQHNG